MIKPIRSLMANYLLPKGAKCMTCFSTLGLNLCLACHGTGLQPIPWAEVMSK